MVARSIKLAQKKTDKHSSLFWANSSNEEGLAPDAAVEVVVAESDGELELAVDVLHAGADVIKTLLVFVADAQEKSQSVRPRQVFQVSAMQVRQVPT